jgi:hypothetical protein
LWHDINSSDEMNGDSRYSTAIGCMVFLVALSIGSNYANDDSVTHDPGRTYHRKKDGLLSSTELVVGIDGSTSVVKRPFPIFGKSVITDMDGDGRTDEVEYSNLFQRKVYRRIDQISCPHLFEAADAELRVQKKRFQPLINGNALARNE